MLDPNVALEPVDAFAWLAVIAAAAFLVSWLFTDVLNVHRTAYVGVLAILAGALAVGYPLWSDQSATFWTHNWAWGLLGAVVTGALLAVLIRRSPEAHASARHIEAGRGFWEGLVYGAAEGLLLSVLPVLTIWQGFAAAGWTVGWLGVVAAAAALAGSALVIVVHHLGYREYRSRAVIQPVIGCLILSVGFLLTASPLAAVGGHIVLHLAMLRHGIELPPHAHAVTEMRGEGTPAFAR